MKYVPFFWHITETLQQHCKFWPHNYIRDAERDARAQLRCKSDYQFH